MVFSGYRFARQAAENNQPIAILTRGKTRADDLATFKIDNNIESVGVKRPTFLLTSALLCINSSAA